MKLFVLIFSFALSFHCFSKQTIGIHYVDLNSKSSTSSASPALAFITLTNTSNIKYHFEMRVGASVDSDVLDQQEFDVSSQVGFYLKRPLDIGWPLKPYFLIGLHRFKIKTGSDNENSEMKKGTMYGVGATMKLYDKVDLTMEYGNYLKSDDLKMSGVSIGFSVPY